MAEYVRHGFRKEWHDKVEEFLEENDDLAFDSPKYFIKFCVNKYMDDKSDSISESELNELKDKIQSLNKELDE